jgi:hypothetical protein
MGNRTTRSSTPHIGQRFSDWLDRSGRGRLPYAPLLVFAALLLAVLLVIGILAQPITDDFWMMAYAPKESALHLIRYYYQYLDGRFANIIVMVLGVKIFGVLAVKVAPVLEVLSLVAASIWLVWQLPIRQESRLERAVVLGGAFTGVLLLVVPSIFDSLAWYTPSTGYVTSLTGMVLIAALFIHLYSRPVRPLYQYSLFGLLVFFCQGFNEPAAILTCLAASVLLLYTLIRRRKATAVAVTLWAGAVAGFAAVYFAPGTHAREQTQHAALSLHTVFIDSLRDFWFTKHALLSWRVALIFVLGSAFALAMLELSKRTRQWLAGLGLVLCVVPTYITSITTHYANSAGGGVSPTRTVTIPFAFLVAGLVCLAVALVQSLAHMVRRWLPVTLYIAIPVSLAVSLQPVLNVIRAEILRGSLLRYREAYIQAQLAAHQQTVYVMPAPILLDDSQTADFSYIENHQAGWLLSALVDYYGLRGKTIKVASTPPPGYCLTHSEASWWGAYSSWWGVHTCQTEAAQQVQTAPYTLEVPAGVVP